MHYPVSKAASRFVQQAFGVVVRAFVTLLVVGMCVVVMMHFLGMPVPSVSQVWHGLTGLSKFARFS